MRVLSLLLPIGVLVVASPAVATANRGEAERQCREWADSLFVSETEAKARELAKCIAERDPHSAEARAAREATRLENEAQAERERRANEERSRRAARQAAESKARCGDATIPAFGILDFCDSPKAVKDKVAQANGIECEASGDCDRLKLTAGPLSLTAYPKYFEGGLYRIAFYSSEHTADGYESSLRNEWEKLISFVEEEYGSSIGPPSPFPPFFSVDGVHIAYTHHWKLGRKRIHVGVFEGGEVYAAIMVVEDEVQKSHKERGE
jgi:hypothetical protein